MKSLLFFLSFVIPLKADWIDLFDGKSTDGWTPRSEVIQFEAKNNELHLRSKTNVWVTTKIEMSDFEAELEVLLPKEPGFNSGLAFRCQGAMGKPKGYQVEIDRKVPGGIYGIGLGGWLSQEKGCLKNGEWNHFRVIAQGDHIRTFVNGHPVSDIREKKQLKGYFGIQHHGKGGVVKLRNIRARALDSTLEKPNILWIVAEDLSPALGCYGDPDARTPHLDALAKESLLFSHAFAAYPVCSPSRSCLITGMYPTTTGTGQMRSAFPLPEGTKGFPEYLRAAGYHTTNNVKTDYNSADAPRLTSDSWVESSPQAHWRSRKEGQPFFSVFNDMTTHQSRTMVWPYAVFKQEIQSQLSADKIHESEKVRIPSYYPDTPLIRREVARFHDCVTVMDKNVGRILSELETDGLDDDTIVFYYSDHGSGMPRHKRLLTDSGMQVPLMVRIPKKWRHLAPGLFKAGEKTDKLVSFVDFAPTVLALACLEVPAKMQGHNFLDGSKTCDWIYGARERVDEVFDCSRSVRNGRWLFIRNYHPHLGWNQASAFSDLGEIKGELSRYHSSDGPRTPAYLRYMTPYRDFFEFYDCEADPDNTENLLLSMERMSKEERTAFRAAEAAYKKLRRETFDTGCLPEGIMAELIEKEGKPVADLVGEGKIDLESIWEVVDSIGTNIEIPLKKISSPDPSKRFWSIIALRNFPEEISGHLRSPELLNDPVADVCIVAASWLAEYDDSRTQAINSLIAELDHESWPVALRACREIELLGPVAKSALPAMKKLYARTRHEKGDAAMFLAFSSGAFLDQLGEKTEPWEFFPKLKE